MQVPQAPPRGVGRDVLVPDLGCAAQGVERVLDLGGDACPQQAGNSTNPPGCPDADGDGVADVADPFPADGEQWEDTDGDGLGDNPGLNGEPFPQDLDNDGIPDMDDTDRDGDGISDATEVSAGTDPANATSRPEDLDRDGIPDAEDSDTDGDGFADELETALGTDPLDPTSSPSDLDGSAAQRHAALFR